MREEITGPMPDTSQERGGALGEAIGKAFLHPDYREDLMEKCGVDSFHELAFFFMKDPTRAEEIIDELAEKALDKDNQSMSG